MRTRPHRGMVRMLLGKILRGHGLAVDPDAIAKSLGYPLAEASAEELRGVIAALDAVVAGERRPA